MLLHLAPLAMLKGGCVTLDPRTQRKCSRRIDRGGRLSPVACVQQRLPRRSSSPLRAMLDLCYSEKCIATMGAENNWDDCGLDDTCGACPARFCMRPCCAHRCHGSTSPHASLGYLPERQSRAPPRGGAARLCRGYSAAAPRPRHLHRARTRVYPMGCAYTPSSPAVAEYCSAAQRIGTWLPSSNGCGEQFFS